MEQRRRPFATWLGRLQLWRARRLLASAAHADRQKGAGLLAQVAPTAATPLLIQILKDEHHLVRTAAAESLASLRIPETLPALLDALEEAVGNHYLSTALWESVERITGELAGFDFNAPEPDQRRRIADWRRKMSTAQPAS